MIRAALISALFVAGICAGCTSKTDHPDGNSNAGPLFAERFIEYRPSGVTIAVLKDWDVSITGQTATMYSPDKELTALVYASPEKTYEDALKKGIEQVATYVDSARTDGTNIKWDIVPGLSATNEKGIGVKAGKPVGWGSCVVKTPAAPLQVVWYVGANTPNRDADLEQMRLTLSNIRLLSNSKRTANNYIVE